MLSMILYIFFEWVIWLIEFACFWVRFCEETNSLISDAIDVSYPVSSCSNFYSAMSFYFFIFFYFS